MLRCLASINYWQGFKINIKIIERTLPKLCIWYRWINSVCTIVNLKCFMKMMGKTCLQPPLRGIENMDFLYRALGSATAPESLFIHINRSRTSSHTRVELKNKQIWKWRWQMATFLESACQISHVAVYYVPYSQGRNSVMLERRVENKKLPIKGLGKKYTYKAWLTRSCASWITCLKRRRWEIGWSHLGQVRIPISLLHFPRCFAMVLESTVWLQSSRRTNLQSRSHTHTKIINNNNKENNN